MMIDVHVAFLFAAISVMFGIAYTVGSFLDKKTQEVLAKRAMAATGSEEMPEVINA